MPDLKEKRIRLLYDGELSVDLPLESIPESEWLGVMSDALPSLYLQDPGNFSLLLNEPQAKEKQQHGRSGLLRTLNLTFPGAWLSTLPAHLFQQRHIKALSQDYKLLLGKIVNVWPKPDNPGFSDDVSAVKHWQELPQWLTLGPVFLLTCLTVFFLIASLISMRQNPEGLCLSALIFGLLGYFYFLTMGVHYLSRNQPSIDLWEDSVLLWKSYKRFLYAIVNAVRKGYVDYEFVTPAGQQLQGREGLTLNKLLPSEGTLVIVQYRDGRHYRLL